MSSIVPGILGGSPYRGITYARSASYPRIPSHPAAQRSGDRRAEHGVSTNCRRYMARWLVASLELRIVRTWCVSDASRVPDARICAALRREGYDGTARGA
jgi:hypothetical protein